MDGVRIEGADVADGSMITARIRVNRSTRYDGVQVNTHVYDAKGVVRFTEVNGRQVSLYRLFVGKDEIDKGGGLLVLKAVIEGSAERVRVRASIIQEHKEVEYDERVLDVT